jgi:cation diffusion facilitator CzcD-associated flavoprotein CzcO
MPSSGESFDVAILGAGFGGFAMARRLAETGVDDVVIFERNDGVGGTWRANSYPGAACDVPSHLYSLSFAPNPHWSRTYASQPEILRYIEDCYDRFDVRRKVRPSTQIVAASWQDDRRCWRLRDAYGTEYEANVLVSAIGLFHTPSTPDLPGLGDFTGTVFHSARWNHDHDLTGRRVAVIGTGASAIQVVPAVAERTEHLVVYQRTPAWILPRRDAPITEEQQRAFAADPEAALRHRTELYELFEQNIAFIPGPTADLLAEIGRSYLERKVADPALRAKLSPDYPIGCKRVLVSSDFYPAVQRDDVELVTERIDCVTPTGIRSGHGTERPCDTIVLCTGFRATEYLRGIDVIGREGTSIHDHWAGVPRAYHGMAVPGFPNFFLLYGPNTNQGGNSIILILEAQAHFVALAIQTMRERRMSSVEVRPEAMQRYVVDLKLALDGTVWSGACDSYFRTPGGEIVTQLPHTSRWYRDRTRRFDPDDFAMRTSDALR